MTQIREKLSRKLIAVALIISLVTAIAGIAMESLRADAVGTPSSIVLRSIPVSGTVVDISKWNGNVDFSAMKSQGVSGVMIRASYGTEKDEMLEANALGATLAAVPYGAYSYATWHIRTNFITAMAQATAEADALVAYLSTKVVTGYVALDIEAVNPNNIYLSKTELTTIANYYMDILKAAGYKPMLYTSASLLCSKFNISGIKYPLWIAYYNNTGSSAFPDTTYGNLLSSLKNRLVMWQYTCSASGAAYGVSSQAVDLNHLYYSFIG